MAPEVYAMQHPWEDFNPKCYNVQSAELFTLGVCLFKMCFFCEPWQKPVPQDKGFFNIVIKGNLKQFISFV